MLGILHQTDSCSWHSLGTQTTWRRQFRQSVRHCGISHYYQPLTVCHCISCKTENGDNDSAQPPFSPKGRSRYTSRLIPVINFQRFVRMFPVVHTNNVCYNNRQHLPRILYAKDCCWVKRCAFGWGFSVGLRPAQPGVQYECLPVPCSNWTYFKQHSCAVRQQWWNERLKFQDSSDVATDDDRSTTAFSCHLLWQLKNRK